MMAGEGDSAGASFQPRAFKGGAGLVLRGDAGGPDSAPAVVLLHGGGQTRHSWHGASRRLLAGGYSVINLDARGHGESAWAGAEGYAIDSYAQDLEAVADTLAVPFAVVGASLGGATALRALTRGLTPSALVLVDIVPEPERAGVERIRDFMAARPGGFGSVEEVADAVAAYNPHRQRPRDHAGLLRNLRRDHDGRLHWHWDPRILSRSIDESLAEMAETVDRLKHTQACPTLLVRGADSDVVRAAGMARLTAIMPKVRIAEVHGAGHMVAGDRNDAFNDEMLAFLRRHMPVPA